MRGARAETGPWTVVRRGHSRAQTGRPETGQTANTRWPRSTRGFSIPPQRLRAYQHNSGCRDRCRIATCSRAIWRSIAKPPDRPKRRSVTTGRKHRIGTKSETRPTGMSAIAAFDTCRITKIVLSDLPLQRTLRNVWFQRQYMARQWCRITPDPGRNKTDSPAPGRAPRLCRQPQVAPASRERRFSRSRRSGRARVSRTRPVAGRPAVFRRPASMQARCAIALQSAFPDSTAVGLHPTGRGGPRNSALGSTSGSVGRVPPPASFRVRHQAACGTKTGAAVFPAPGLCASAAPQHLGLRPGTRPALRRAAAGRLQRKPLRAPEVGFKTALCAGKICVFSYCFDSIRKISQRLSGAAPAPPAQRRAGAGIPAFEAAQNCG